MPAIVLDNLTDRVHLALKSAFTELMTANPDAHFYAFAVFTDDSLQFLNPAANTEEALTTTVQRYREDVDPKYGCSSTRTGMRWSYGDWGFFANFGTGHFDEINEALIENIDGPDDVYESRIDSLWAAVLEGFQRLEEEEFFGKGEGRSKITLLAVGDLPEELVVEWVSVLNPPEVAASFINWDADATDDADANG